MNWLILYVASYITQFIMNLFFINHNWDCTLSLFLLFNVAYAVLLITLFLLDYWKQFARGKYRRRGCDIVPPGNTHKTRIMITILFQ